MYYKISNIIKEFLYHSLSNKQLTDLEEFFNKNKTNVDLDSLNHTTMFSEINLLGGIANHVSDDDLIRLKTDGISLSFRNYRGRNYTEIIHLNCD